MGTLQTPPQIVDLSSKSGFEQGWKEHLLLKTLCRGEQACRWWGARPLEGEGQHRSDSERSPGAREEGSPGAGARGQETELKAHSKRQRRGHRPPPGQTRPPPSPLAPAQGEHISWMVKSSLALLLLPSSPQGQRGVGWGAEGAESWHTMLVTAHGWAREAPGASGPQAAPRASNATGVLAAGPLKTCRTFLGPSSSALSSTLPSRPWEVQGAAPSVLCALPTQLHVPFIQSHLPKGP